jgi:uncharacterized membrane protein YoaK (UPF0700 family)
MEKIMGTPILLAFICIVTFYAAGEHEARLNGSNYGMLWAILSALISAFVLIVLDGSWSWLLASQVALFIGIGIVRATRKP